MQGSCLYSFDDLLQDGEYGLLEDISFSYNELIYGLFDECFQVVLVDVIVKLLECECLVLVLYYDEEFNFKEIGEVLGVSELWVSQLYSQCVVCLCVCLVDWWLV